METLQNKTALVTGVGRKQGIGAAICYELARHGCNIFFTYWHQYDVEQFPDTEKNPAAFAEDLRQMGVTAQSMEIDLRAHDAADVLFKKATETLGSPDILINNATYSTHQTFQNVDAALLDNHYAVNVRAATLLCKAFAAQGKGGAILNLTSGQSLGVMPDELPYTITKASVEMLVHQLAPELNRQGVAINALDPGPTDTGWITDAIREKIKNDQLHEKINTPEEVAKIAVEILLGNTTGKIVHAGM